MPTFNLNVNQTYMHVGETIQLTADTSKSSVTLGSITWASMDSSVAMVDSTGKVTAIGEGTTTIYATESTYTLKAMAIINVAKSGAVAISAVRTGGYGTISSATAVLKEDGTVWTMGTNNNGQLGDGTNLNRNQPVQVKINSNTYLTNVIKISVGWYHMMALTEDGHVYVWGANTDGQLGINSTNDQNYATLVLGYNGED